MEISKTFANQMVEELSGIIHQHINFMDKQGIIIASTDKSRIDSRHMGAYQLLQQALSCLYIDSDHEFPGSKKGVNLPIVVEEEVVGVIGITGERKTVAKYGQIIKKFTEMYIRDNSIRQEKELDEKIRGRFLHQWLTDSDFYRDQNLIDLGLSVGVDVMIKRRIVLAKFMLNDEHNLKEAQNLIEEATKTMKRIFCNDRDCFLVRIGAKLVFLIKDCNDDELLTTCKNQVQDIRDNYGLSVSFGLDEKARMGKDLYLCYAQAKKASSACQPSHGINVKAYRDLTIELFLHDVPQAIKQEFIHRIFGSCTEAEISEYRSILALLYQNNGSIEKVAKELFIHKNTLQYKLNKLNDFSGYNPRNTSDIPLFYLALRFYDMIDEG